MATLFQDTGQAPDQGFVQLTEIFNLEDQLAAAAASADDNQIQKEQS
jgi:L-rhamnose mutarotase